MIDEARMERAMNYLAETDDEYAAEKAAVESSEIARKRVRARLFLVSAGTVAERQAAAETHTDTLKADDEYIASLTAYERLRARRQRADLVINLWRTYSANLRASA